MKKVKLYTEKEFGQLMSDYLEVEEIVFVALMNKRISIDEVPQRLRIENSQFYIYAHRSCSYLRSDNDLKAFYLVLKCLCEDIDEGKRRDLQTRKLQTLLSQYKNEAIANRRMRAYVTKKEKRDNALYLHR